MAISGDKREHVADLINSVLVRIRAPEELSREILNMELQDLKGIIEKLRTDLSETRPNDISDTYIPNATDELDAVVGTTELATGKIMDSCDEILKLSKEKDAEFALKMETLVVNIFEACSFQDITGQRIKKVASSLKQIDAKIKTVLTVIEEQIFDLHYVPVMLVNSDTSLMSGPALPMNAVSQDEIDLLLANLDQGRGL